MHKKNLLLILASFMIPVLANAGFVQPAPVMIDLEFMSAQGDMFSARNSSNDDEFIGCGTRHTEDGAGGVFIFGFCQAQLEAEMAVTCFTTNPALLDGIDNVADASFLTFSWSDDGEGNLTCTRIGSSTQSFYLEKGKAN